MDREVEREKVEVALNGEGKRNNHPAAVTNNEEDDEEKAHTQKTEKRCCVPINGLAGHPRGGDEKAEGDESEANLLSGEVLHVDSVRGVGMCESRNVRM